jgi:Rieske Fe-S protein
MPILKFTRRDFCVQSVQTASLAAISAALTGCGGSSGSSNSPTSPTPSTGFPALATIDGVTTVNNTITLNIDATSPLLPVGSAALVRPSTPPLLVVHTGQDTFVALTAICTHEQCTVSTFQDQTFECPCHGSRYNTSGSVVRGPATRSLTRFTTNFTNGRLTITLA